MNKLTLKSVRYYRVFVNNRVRYNRVPLHFYSPTAEEGSSWKDKGIGWYLCLLDYISIGQFF